MIDAFPVDPVGDIAQPNWDYLKTLKWQGDQVADGAIGGGHIIDESIMANHILAGTITAVQIAANTITAELIVAGTITAEEIAAGAITTEKLAALAVTAEKIAANTITAVEIAAGTITAEEIAANTITGALIAAETITSEHILTGTLTGDLIASDTITGDHLIAGTITSAHINVTQLSAIAADLGIVTAGKVEIGTPGGAKVAIGQGISTSLGNFNGIVGTDATNAITFLLRREAGDLYLKGAVQPGSTGLGNIAGQIHGTDNVEPATILRDRLVANTITAAEIAAGTITAVEMHTSFIAAGKIVAGWITGANIDAGTITSAQIEAGSITADRLDVTVLSAISADLGTVTAGILTGALIRTAATGTRVQMDSGGLKGIDSSGTEMVKITGAGGLELMQNREGSGGSGAGPDSVSWIDSDLLPGFIFHPATIMSYDTAFRRTIEVHAKGLYPLDDKAEHRSELRASAWSSAGGAHIGSAAVYAEGQPGIDLWRVRANADAASPLTIIDSDAASDFLKLATTADRKINMGTAEVTFSGSSTCAPLGVSHGLGKTPVVALCIDLTSGGFAGPDVIYGTRSYGATTFTVVARHHNNTAFTGTRNFVWIAIG